jgi:hypothetical protein
MQSIPVQIGASLPCWGGKMLPHRMKRVTAPKPDLIVLLRFSYPIICPRIFPLIAPCKVYI